MCFCGDTECPSCGTYQGTLAEPTNEETLHQALARHSLRAVREDHPHFGLKMRVFDDAQPQRMNDRDMGWWSADRGWQLIQRLDAGEDFRKAVLTVNQAAATKLMQELGADRVVHLTSA